MRYRRLLSALVGAIALLGGAAGCRSPHLGDGYGKAVRRALALQAGRSTRPLPPLDAEDAKQILARHRAQAGAPGTATGGAMPALPLPTPGGH